MIYPKDFPETSSNRGEELVFKALKTVSNQYDIFYSRKFVSQTRQERYEYEIDFLIIDPSRAIICLEVKGGMLDYDGASDKWSQNGHVMDKSPVDQIQSAMHSLMNRYRILRDSISMGWGLFFPECHIPDKSTLPTNIHPDTLLDDRGTQFVEEHIEAILNHYSNLYNKPGLNERSYELFKKDLLRGIGFVQHLGTKIRHEQEVFLELTDEQYEVFLASSEEKKLIIKGPAGSGKTVIAKSIAEEKLNEGQSVLFLCFNKMLSRTIGYSIPRNDSIDVSSFHHFARRQIDSAFPGWWEEQSDKTDDFWAIDVPAQLDEIPDTEKKKFDCIIVDEGQDFKFFWFEVIAKHLKDDGNFYIFLDSKQNIFGNYTDIPDRDSFRSCVLSRNCRNTGHIIKYLEGLIESPIQSFKNTPSGVPVDIRTYKNDTEQQTLLLNDIKHVMNTQGIQYDQILILANTSKADSCISEVRKINNKKLVSLYNNRYQRNSIHYVTINMFKGLEAAVVFIIDIDKVDEEKLIPKLYTEASRAVHSLYIYRKE
jgi:DNA polymerase III delta prime subunit